MEDVRGSSGCGAKEMKFLTFGSSRKIGLRRNRRLAACRLRIDEGVGVARADHAPAVLRAAEQVRPPLADARDPVHPGEDAGVLQAP